MKYIVFALLLLSFSSVAEASQTQGVILAGSNLTKICQDVTCTLHGNVNWKPTINASTPGATAVSITDAGITGTIWGDEIGWINLSPQNGGVTVNSLTGELSGYAFSNTGGWINFRPTQNAGNPNVGVTIDSNGQFSGYAYVSGVKGGWMKFDCTSSSTCIKTDWRSTPNRNSQSNAGGGGGGGAPAPTAVSAPLQPPPKIDLNTPEAHNGNNTSNSNKSVGLPTTPEVVSRPALGEKNTTTEEITQVSKKQEPKTFRVVSILKKIKTKAWILAKPAIYSWYGLCVSLASYFQSFVNFFNLNPFGKL